LPGRKLSGDGSEMTEKKKNNRVEKNHLGKEIGVTSPEGALPGRRGRTSLVKNRACAEGKKRLEGYVAGGRGRKRGGGDGRAVKNRGTIKGRKKNSNAKTRGAGPLRIPKESAIEKGPRKRASSRKPQQTTKKKGNRYAEGKNHAELLILKGREKFYEKRGKGASAALLQGSRLVQRKKKRAAAAQKKTARLTSHLKKHLGKRERNRPTLVIEKAMG